MSSIDDPGPRRCDAGMVDFNIAATAKDSVLNMIN